MMRESASLPDARRSRPVVLTAVTFLLLWVTLAACGPISEGGSTPSPVQSAPPAIPGAAQTPDLAGAGAAPGTSTVVIPGMPSCGPGPAAEDTPTAAAPEPVVQSSPIVTPFVFFNGGKLADSWSDASWGGVKPEFQSGGCSRHGLPTVKVVYGSGWGAFSIADWNKRNTPDTTRYSHLHFWVNGGDAGGQALGVMVYTNGGEGQRLRVDKYIKGGKVPANVWQEVFIPLVDLQADGGKAERVVFQDVSGGSQPAVYLDGIELFKDSTPPPTPVVTDAQITIDLSSDRQPISPLIYGFSQAPADVVKAANASVNRMGGNATSRYNWTLGDARNAGSDWEYRNYSREGNDPAYKEPSGLADMFVKGDKGAGAETILTIPMIGYVAKNDDNNTRSTGVPEEGGAPVSPGSEAIPGYDPSRNQQTTSVKSYPRKGAPFQYPPDTSSGKVYQDEWVSHLVKTFGKAADGGVRFYSMDNEPDLWADNTHVDVHPTRVGYDDLLKLFLDYSTAVKAVDPTAQVTGPVVSGWTGYWYSALDRGSDSFRSAADRKANGDTPLLPWFLDQVRKHDQAEGGRALDVLDIHYYPQAQGLLQDKTDKATSALRLRSTRSLWDPTYQDESWIARSDPRNVDLIPRMRQWIDQYYPGTKLGITEWKWGAESTMNGALAIADVLGIYGREGVYLANYWTNPPLNSPGLEAFKLYRNYDGRNSTFGDTSVRAQSSVADMLTAYASDDTAKNQLKVIVVNKSDTQSYRTTVDLQGAGFQGQSAVYQLSNATGGAVKPLPGVGLAGSSLTYTFPPYSATLLVISRSR